MRALLVACGIGATVLLAQQSDVTKNPFAGSASAASAGGRRYNQACQSCHGPAGQGDRGPALNTRRFAFGGEDSDLFHVIRAGIPGTQMPAFGQLTDEETWELVTYVRSLPPLAGSSAGAGAPGPAIT